MLWTFPERVELHKGRPVSLSPAPNRRHQSLVGYLFRKLADHTEPLGCETFIAPFDVRLPVSSVEGKVDTVVQPDLCVICDESKLERQGCNGAPDLIVEVVSPKNRSNDTREKFGLYEAAGVPEYWIVFPKEDTISVFVLRDGRYVGLQPASAPGILTSVTLPGFSIDLEAAFAR